MKFEDALVGMKAGKRATFPRCRGSFFVTPVYNKKYDKYDYRLYYQTPEGIVARQYKLGVNWVLNCDWVFISKEQD